MIGTDGKREGEKDKEGEDEKERERDRGKERKRARAKEIEREIERERKRALTKTYQKDRLEYIRGQIDKMRNSVEDRQLISALQTVIEVSKKKKNTKKKNTSTTKIKSASPKEILQK